jgi:HSP20 family protein
MNALTTRSPFSLFDEFFGRDTAPGFFIKPLHGDPLPQQIRLDVKEVEGGYEIDAEIPGVRKEDIQVTIDGNVVGVRAEVRQHDEQKDGTKVLRSERYYGAVARSVALPAELDRERAGAKYVDGVLKLTLPRAKSTSAQRLTIE